MAQRHPATSTAKILPFPPRPKLPEKPRIRYLSPEHDGLCLLYAHHALSKEKLYAVKILAWARRSDGSQVAILPWLNSIACCGDLRDVESGATMGYYDPVQDRRFSEIPAKHSAMLAAMAAQADAGASGVVQEIPDMIGSHAAMLAPDSQHFELQPVVSWQLDADGDMTAMLADSAAITQLPVLPGDPCLYRANSRSGFRYFFQYHIANQIKSGDSVATRALRQLITP